MLFTLYTNECRGSSSDVFNIKYADDTAIVGLITEDEVDYRRGVDEFVDWCQSSFLQLNIRKTKIIFDFRTIRGTHQQIAVNGEGIEAVNEYKYLGTIIDEKLTWDVNTAAVYKKGLQRLNFMRKLRQSGVDTHLLALFYRSFVESILTFSFVAWYFSLSVVNKNKLNKIVNMASKIAGKQQHSMIKLCEFRAVRKSHAILRDASHPLYGEYELLPSGRRYSLPLLQTARAQRSFISSSIALLNTFLWYHSCHFYIYGRDSVVVKGMWFDAGSINL